MDYFQQTLGRSVDVQYSPSENSRGGQKTCFQKLECRKEIVMVHSQRGALRVHGHPRQALGTLPQCLASACLRTGRQKATGVCRSDKGGPCLKFQSIHWMTLVSEASMMRSWHKSWLRRKGNTDFLVIWDCLWPNQPASWFYFFYMLASRPLELCVKNCIVFSLLSVLLFPAGGQRILIV